MKKVKKRLNKIKIEVGRMIGEPIAIMCYHKSSIRSKVVKIHPKVPKKDIITFLQESIAFILILNESVARKGKVCKTCDAFALNSLLLVKFVSEKLRKNEWFKVFKFDFAWIVASLQEQAKKYQYLQNLIR